MTTALLATFLIMLFAVVMPMAPARAAAASGPESGSSARLRFADLLPGVGSTQVALTPFAGGDAVQLGLSGYGALTAYRTLPAGFYAVALLSGPAGGSPQSAAAAGQARRVIGAVEVRADSSITVVLSGTVTSARVTAVDDQSTRTLPHPGSAQLRLLAGRPDMVADQVRVAHGPVLAADLSYGESTGYDSLPTGSWPLELVSPDGSTRALGSVALASGDIYTALVLDDPSGTGPVIRMVRDSAGGQAVVPVSSGGAPGGGLTSDDTLVVALAELLAAAALVVIGLRLRRRHRDVAAPETGTASARPQVPAWDWERDRTTSIRLRPNLPATDSDAPAG